MLAQALDEALQPALQYLKYKKLRLFSGSDLPGPEEEAFVLVVSYYSNDKVMAGVRCREKKAIAREP